MFKISRELKVPAVGSSLIENGLKLPNERGEAMWQHLSLCFRTPSSCFLGSCQLAAFLHISVE